ncbi:MAG: YafY family protein [Litoreibacter sp.]|uniref:helix-turn-helix transcriptional regulator n=1 Tax=Litoreibacter sp. TaxID=1969459 RepID=UPI0032993951
MSRIFRLHQLLQTIRNETPPVTAERLAMVMEVSVRTIHRDVATLRQLGAGIDGAAGYGFTLGDDVSVPPLSFGNDELEALVLGLREVEEIGDTVLSGAARQALTKLKARLPESQSKRLRHAVLTAKHFRKRPEILVDVAAIRQATWEEKEIGFNYRDAQGVSTARQVRPLSITYFEHNTCLISWCLLRKNTRVFRLDRMADLLVTETSFRPNRVALLHRAIEHIRATPFSGGEQGKAKAVT